VTTSGQQLTQLLREWTRGDSRVQEALAAIIYGELRRQAHRYMRRERPDHTLQASALVHEAYLRLIDQRTDWKSRAHFFAVASRMMRRILVDYAKEHAALKRGGAVEKVPLEQALTLGVEPRGDFVALDEALTGLEKIDPQRAQIVELRFFGGLSNQETAAVLSISSATAQRQWAGARAWLYRELSHSG
jgi:RNA polymerase sigma factor (TIGR02999 family)